MSLFFLISVGQVWADQITLKNGDVVSGTIIKKDGDKLTIRSEFLGEITMPWNAVTSVKSDNPLYVVLPGGNEVNGKLTTAAGNVKVETPQKPEAPLDKVSAIRNADEEAKYEKLQHPSWFQLWAGYFDLGYALARGNAETETLNTGFTATRTTKTDQTTLFLNQIYSTAVVNNVNAATANSIRGGVSYSHNISPRFFGNFTNTDETDEFQDLNFRFVAGLGLGYHAVKSERMTLDLGLGGDYDHAAFTTMTRNLAEANFVDTFTYKLAKSSTLTQSFQIYDAPVDNQYRINFDLGTSTTLRKWLSWQVTGSDRFLSDPLQGRKRNDLILTTGIRATFSH